MLTRILVLATLVATACASSEAEEPDAPMSTMGDPDEQDEPEHVGCAPGTHVCGDTCMADNTNNVAVGCRFGCGQPCGGGANGTASCTALGTCGLDCNPGFSNVNGECVVLGCSDLGYVCGNATDDDGGSVSCGTCLGSASCATDNTCIVPADSYEPNQTRTAADDLGAFDDYDDATRTVAALSVGNAMDEDWFKFRVVDGWDANNPDVRVQLSVGGGALAANHELTVWFKCDVGDATSVSCGEGSSTHSTNNSGDAMLGNGCAVNAKNVVWAAFEPNCSGTDDTGVAYVRVRKLSAPRGDTYDLYVEAM